MATSSDSILFPSVILFLLLAPALAAGKCNEQDKKALLALAAHFNNPSLFTSWTKDTACCDWPGVNCGIATDRVVDIRILPANVGYLSGTIPPAIGDIPNLIHVSFTDHPNLVGSIPSTITKLTRLLAANFSSNSLSGPIPPSISKLTTIFYFLDLSHNKFSGYIPPTLANIQNLRRLHLDHNQLTGPIPDSFGSFNHMSPPDLYLSDNKLSGPIPATLAGPRWGVVDISRNQLSGDASVVFQSSETTTQIDISRNWFEFDLTKVKFPMNLGVLDISHNMIYGKIPTEINQFSNLWYLDMSYNRLCGEIPAGKVTAKQPESRFSHNKCLCGAPLPACK